MTLEQLKKKYDYIPSKYDHWDYGVYCELYFVAGTKPTLEQTTLASDYCQLVGVQGSPTFNQSEKVIRAWNDSL